MSLSLVEDIKPVSELKSHTKEVFNQLHKTKRPIVITVNGKPDAVLIDVNKFEEQIKLLNLKVFLDEAENDIKNNRVRPIEDFFSDWDKK
jgi:prevent-host-death family protein